MWLPRQRWQQLPTHNASCYPDAIHQIMQWMWRGGGHRSQSQAQRVFLCSICSRVSRYLLITGGNDGDGTGVGGGGGGGLSITSVKGKNTKPLYIFNCFSKRYLRDVSPAQYPDCRGWSPKNTELEIHMYACIHVLTQQKENINITFK